MTIIPFSSTLSDGSEVWDVALRDDGQEIIIPCLSEKAAIHLASTLADSISEAVGVPHKPYPTTAATH